MVQAVAATTCMRGRAMRKKDTEKGAEERSRKQKNSQAQMAQKQARACVLFVYDANEEKCGHAHAHIPHDRGPERPARRRFCIYNPVPVRLTASSIF